MLFDYRVKHRGLGNASTEERPPAILGRWSHAPELVSSLGTRARQERPMLYITYARPFWLDVYNFDRKRYTELTPTYRELLTILYRRYTNLP